jgi:hypothetical protein
VGTGTRAPGLFQLPTKREPLHPALPRIAFATFQPRFGGLPFLRLRGAETEWPDVLFDPETRHAPLPLPCYRCGEGLRPRGMTLPDERAAQHYARRTARNFRRILEGQEFKIRVTDEKGQVVYEAHPDEE